MHFIIKEYYFFLKTYKQKEIGETDVDFFGHREVPTILIIVV